MEIKWKKVCNKCGTANAQTSRICNKCKNDLDPIAPLKISLWGQNKGIRHNPESGNTLMWVCPECSELNQKDNIECASCEFDRTGKKKPKKQITETFTDIISKEVGKRYSEKENKVNDGIREAEKKAANWIINKLFGKK
jgi:ribosomal protein L40E